MKMAGKFPSQGTKEGERWSLLRFGLLPITIKAHKPYIPEFWKEDKVCPPALTNHLRSMLQSFFF
jgi:hypothetical protein